MTAARLREMFDQMVVAKNADLIETFYHRDFVMYSDGMAQDFADFAEGHRRIYASPISYEVEYDDEAWVETADRVAGRIWITTSRPGEAPTRIEVVLIVGYVDGLIHRIWETTWPSWRNVDALADYEATDNG